MWYWTAATILVLVSFCGVLGNLLMLPGNWLMVGALALFVAGTGGTQTPGWTNVAVCAGIAVVGEIVELVAGSAKASQKGASRRAMLLSFALSLVGSVAGTFLVPIPVVGSAVGAVAGAALGAFSGAWIGEAWKGSEAGKRTEIGAAAMTGRMIGMLAKLTAGVAIFVFQVVVLFF
jgi:hypothetical protein